MLMHLIWGVVEAVERSGLTKDHDQVEPLISFKLHEFQVTFWNDVRDHVHEAPVNQNGR
jgi:hypothetical protein